MATYRAEVRLDNDQGVLQYGEQRQAVMIVTPSRQDVGKRATNQMPFTASSDAEDPLKLAGAAPQHRSRLTCLATTAWSIARSDASNRDLNTLKSTCNKYGQERTWTDTQMVNAKVYSTCEDAKASREALNRYYTELAETRSEVGWRTQRRRMDLGNNACMRSGD